MSAIRLMMRAGQRVEMEGRNYRFVKHGSAGRHVFEDEETGLPETRQIEHLLRLLEAGSFAPLPDLPTVLEGRPATSIDDLVDPALRAGTARRLAYVQAWKDSGASLSEFALRPIIDATAARLGDPSPPAPKTLQKWLKELRASGGDPASQIPRIKERGNRRRRLRSPVLDVVSEAFDEVWLQPHQPQVMAVYDRIVARIAEMHPSLTPEERRKITPSVSTVYRERDRIDKYVAIYEREGATAARLMAAPKGQAPPTTRHNEVWEIDHTQAKGKKANGEELILLVREDSSDIVIGQAWLTSMIDRHTRMVSAAVLSFDSPKVELVFDCLRMGILPKTFIASEYPELEHDWPVFGIPNTLVCDNASEFRKAEFIEACRLLGIIIQYTPPRKAWFKGMVERFFRRIIAELFTHVPGSQFAEYFQRMGRAPPDTVATTTLSELRRVVITWIVDSYSVLKHQGLQAIPREAWLDSVRVHGVIPPDPKLVAVALTRREGRTLQAYGIDLDKYIYDSVELAGLRMEIGTGVNVAILIDTLNMGAIRVVHPRTGELIPARAIPRHRAYLEGTTFYEHRLVAALKRQSPERYDGIEGAIIARDTLRRGVERHRGRLKKPERQRKAQFLDHLRRADQAREKAAQRIEAEAGPISGTILSAAFGRAAAPTTPASADTVPPSAPAEPGATGLPPVGTPAAAPTLDPDLADLDEFRRRHGIGDNLPPIPNEDP